MVFAFPIAISFMYGVFIDGASVSSVAGKLYQAYWFPFLLALLIVPIGIRDSFRFSNRIAGPMMRLKRSMVDLAAGHPVRPIQFRPGDFFTDTVDSFNRLVQDYQHLQELFTRGNTSADSKAEHVALQAAKALQRMPGAPLPDSRGTVAPSAPPAGSPVSKPVAAPLPATVTPAVWPTASQNSINA